MIGHFYDHFLGPLKRQWGAKAPDAVIGYLWSNVRSGMSLYEYVFKLANHNKHSGTMIGHLCRTKAKLWAE